MNEIEFMAVLLARNELAHALCVEIDKQRANEPNDAVDVANAWYDFVHAVLYETDAKASLDNENNNSVAYLRRLDEQIGVFCTKNTLELRRAFIIWSAIDNGEFGDL